jgi:prepilin-type N-terminal cleavage/methylation domain-containing protein
MQQKGFTLIELLVVLALIAILAAILIVVIKPGQIFMRGRDAQRQGDLKNLSIAVDAYLTEVAINPTGVLWPARGACTGQSNPNIFFSVSGTLPPTGWPAIPGGHTATGTTSNTTTGSGWVPLNFTLTPVVNISPLPLDPRNGQSGADAGGTTVVFAYSFACDSSYNYEFAAKLEGSTSAMTGDGGNQNGLYELGPGRATLY